MVSLKLRFKADNKGSTLIEIVVSVLIVGIIFVPLLMGLNTAIRANKNSESELYAETVATNCIEVVKAYGNSGLDAYITSLGGGEVEFPDAGVGATIQKVAPKSYVISNLKEGTKVYSAEFNFDSTVYDSEQVEHMGFQNDITGYEMVPDITEGNAIKINMAENLDETYLKFIMDCALNQSGNSSRPWWDDLTDTTKTEEQKLAIVKNWVTKKVTKITIAKETDSSSEHYNDYKIYKQLKYECNSTIDFGGAEFTFPSDAGVLPEYISSDAAPDAILLFYSVLSYTKSADPAADVIYANSSSGLHEIIEIDKQIDSNLAIYTICKQVQPNDTATKEKTDIDGALMRFMIKNDAGGTVKTYCQMTKNYETGSASSEDAFIIRAANSSDNIKKMYDLNINIYDDEGELKATKTSTMVDAA